MTIFGLDHCGRLWTLTLFRRCFFSIKLDQFRVADAFGELRSEDRSMAPRGSVVRLSLGAGPPPKVSAPRAPNQARGAGLRKRPVHRITREERGCVSAPCTESRAILCLLCLAAHCRRPKIGVALATPLLKRFGARGAYATPLLSGVRPRSCPNGVRKIVVTLPFCPVGNPSPGKSFDRTSPDCLH